MLPATKFMTGIDRILLQHRKRYGTDAEVKTGIGYVLLAPILHRLSTVSRVEQDLYSSDLNFITLGPVIPSLSFPHRL